MADTQYLSAEKKAELEEEKKQLETVRFRELAERIDVARQNGDLSENAEYHQAREDLAWTKSRVKEIDRILETAVIAEGGTSDGTIGIGSVVTVEVNGKTKEYTVTGAQEADPLAGKISNESPIGKALFGKSKGDEVSVETPAGEQLYSIKKVA